MKHPLAIRWFHWVNFPVIATMVWSGVLILWANDVYPLPSFRLHIPDHILLYTTSIKAIYSGGDVPEMPKPLVDIALGFRLADGMAWHFALAWFFALNGIGYVLFLALSGEWKHLVPRKESFKEAIKVALADLKFWKKPELAKPGEKFNHAQRIAYSGVIALGLAMLVTGLAIAKPERLSLLVTLLGGYQLARTEHFLVTCLLVSFFFVHVAQVARAGWRNLRGMLVGN